MNIEKALQTILDTTPGVAKISGDLVPLPSTSGEMNNHLLVNVSFLDSDKVDALDAVLLVSKLREIAYSVFCSIRQSFEKPKFSTIVVSVFNPFNETEGRRIYRTRLRVEDLPSLKADNFIKYLQGEESGELRIKKLLVSKNMDP
ncbi:MAG: hypothetical protein PF795_02470 [Kiritimatiellae bacterium]|nr:hypothetical protein [Kiritimatiellia bacterium]